MEPTIDMRFSSPICRVRVDGFEQRQEALVALAGEFQAEDPEGVVSSNLDGWHSRRDIHTRPSPVMTWLVRTLARNTGALVRKLTGGSSGVEVVLRDCWFNVHTAGGWNMPHVHPAWWSGVLYVDGSFDAEGGEILFFNPVPESVRGGYPHHVSIRPEAGTLLLFPGHLSHMVTPYKGGGQRISVSFNIDPDGAG